VALLDVGDAIGDQILHQVLDGLRVLPFCDRLIGQVKKTQQNRAAAFGTCQITAGFF
jgi:hypothetical protein